MRDEGGRMKNGKCSVLVAQCLGRYGKCSVLGAQCPGKAALRTRDSAVEVATRSDSYPFCGA